jgi:hypothetical protein
MPDNDDGSEVAVTGEGTTRQFSALQHLIDE